LYHGDTAEKGDEAMRALKGGKDRAHKNENLLKLILLLEHF